MAASSISSALNLFVVGPWSTSIMFERHKLEKAGKPVPKEINTRFGILHGVSSLLNLVVVAASVTNSLWVGQQWTGSK
ncbi:hypothetical protein HDU97_002914 [Phlyctochytrium planicorne]|nr:hypothetical protein HDU97_002914 [Phlyctochytrium planicorne]